MTSPPVPQCPPHECACVFRQTTSASNCGLKNRNVFNSTIKEKHKVLSSLMLNSQYVHRSALVGQSDFICSQ